MGRKNQAKQMKEWEVTQLGLLHQGQTGAERGSRDPAVGSPRRPPTPSLCKARQGRRMLSQGCGAGLCSLGRTAQEGAHQDQSQAPRNPVTPRGERKQGPLVPSCLFGSGWHERRSIRAQPLLPTAAHTQGRAHTHTSTRAQAPASPPGCAPSRSLRLRIPTPPRDHSRSPPGSLRATPSIRVRAWRGGASRALGPGR